MDSFDRAQSTRTAPSDAPSPKKPKTEHDKKYIYFSITQAMKTTATVLIFVFLHVFKTSEFVRNIPTNITDFHVPKNHSEWGPDVDHLRQYSNEHRSAYDPKDALYYQFTSNGWTEILQAFPNEDNILIDHPHSYGYAKVFKNNEFLDLVSNFNSSYILNNRFA